MEEVLIQEARHILSRIAYLDPISNVFEVQQQCRVTQRFLQNARKHMPWMWYLTAERKKEQKDFVEVGASAQSDL